LKIKFKFNQAVEKIQNRRRALVLNFIKFLINFLKVEEKINHP